MAAVAANKDDRLAFTPNSQLTGELKRLDHGRLYFSTDATDQIAVEWRSVTQLISSQQVQIEMASGLRYLGHLVPSAPAHLTIRTTTDTQTLPMADVVRINPIEETFRERLDMKVSAGYSFTKASDVREIDFGMDIAYTTERRRIDLSSSFTTTHDAIGDDTTRMNATARNLRLRKNRWITGYLANVERNDGLGLDLRTSIGFGIGRFLLQTNTKQLMLLGGLALSREDIQGASASKTTVEGLLSADFNLFHLSDPEIDLSTQLKVFPNFSDFGRVRGQYDLTLEWEVVSDVYWQLKFYDTWDTNSVSEGASDNDYGIVTGLAWKL